ncbi:LOW QUALITY PROTEIN: hypothetical protein HID58_087902 [Brassica napus]|uniref:non-specific serine/threonine protein kinase n=1 Tax=Brassica napus TaxID=3708 RepID=A0ABQ7XUT2_BRANA|nr:LOW QUALITY PROTEIN: hypothetical protein HID58_087902 [Brassica napus]
MASKTPEASLTSSSQSMSVSTLADQVSSTLSFADPSTDTKTGNNNKTSEQGESGKSSTCRPSTSSDISDESTCSSFSSSINNHTRPTIWEAIQAVRTKHGGLGLNHFRLLKRLGCGDIGTVHLAELNGTRCLLCHEALASRKKLVRAQTEREILQCLDHPFLPTLYSHFETEKFSCLVMEFCPGGDLHTLRQRQPGKRFTEQAAKFYVAEVLLAMEYLHMLGIIYRDLKPENVLVRDDGHVMLSDFDLSLRCTVSLSIINQSWIRRLVKELSFLLAATCLHPAAILHLNGSYILLWSSVLLIQVQKDKKAKIDNGNHQVTPLPELVAEPTSARSMSFVGTHEYLAPEIIKGEGHGSAVDWWTFGIFLYELLFGKTPFKGSGNRATLFNVVGQPLRFPESPVVSFAARDLIRSLLVKEPQHRLAYKRGATEMKQHPFFEGVNWALVRCATPPEVPKPVDLEPVKQHTPATPASAASTSVRSDQSNYLEFDFF